MKTHRNPSDRCPAETTLKAIAGRWKLLILRELFGGIRRFGQLKRALPQVSHKVLTQQLRELEDDGIIVRQLYPEVPPRVEYSLTTLGESLRPVLEHLHVWGEQLSGEPGEGLPPQL